MYRLVFENQLKSLEITSFPWHSLFTLHNCIMTSVVTVAVIFFFCARFLYQDEREKNIKQTMFLGVVLRETRNKYGPYKSYVYH